MLADDLAGDPAKVGGLQSREASSRNGSMSHLTRVVGQTVEGSAHVCKCRRGQHATLRVLVQGILACGLCDLQTQGIVVMCV